MREVNLHPWWETPVERFLGWLKPRWFAAYWQLTYCAEMARATGIPHYALLQWLASQR
jgi:hypothetical protein